VSALPKHQHFVPQFLLRSWGAGKNYQVHVFDKQAGRIFASPAKKVGAERGFYNMPESVTRELIERFRAERGPDALPLGFEDGVILSAEGTLATIETRAARVIQSVLDTESLARVSPDDRLWLAGFATVQFLRTPYIRDMFGALVRGMREKITPLIQSHGHDVESALAMAGLPAPTPDRIAEAHLQHLARGVRELLPYFLHKQWMIERAPQGERLYIGDNPITQWNNSPDTTGTTSAVGLGLPHSEVALPLSPRINLRLLDGATVQMIRDRARNYEMARHVGLTRVVSEETVHWLRDTTRALDDGIARELHPEEVTRLNARQVRMASRFVYAADDNFELAQRMLREHPEMRGAPQSLMM
jgi:hypothetical protein